MKRAKIQLIACAAAILLVAAAGCNLVNIPAEISSAPSVSGEFSSPVSSENSSLNEESSVEITSEEKSESSSKTEATSSQKPPVSKPEQEEDSEPVSRPLVSEPASESSSVPEISSSVPPVFPPEEEASRPDSSENIPGEIVYLAYETLSAKEKTVYDEMLFCIGQHMESVEFPRNYKTNEKESESVLKIFSCLMADHPELFSCRRFAYSIYADRVVFIPEYLFDAATAAQMQKEAEKVAENWLKEAPLSGSDYEKSKWVYETLVRKTDYVFGSENNQNYYSVFVQGESVCAGYTAAAQYLLQKLGISSVMVRGEAYDPSTGQLQSHSWNLNLLDGAYYHMDTTWGDPFYAGKIDDQVSYSYLNLTDEMIFITHQLKDNSFAVPKATATENCYFVKEKLQFAVYSAQTLQTAVARQIQKGQTTMAIRYEDEEEYAKLLQALTDGSSFSRILNGAFDEAGVSRNKYAVSYMKNEKQNILELILTLR